MHKAQVGQVRPPLKYQNPRTPKCHQDQGTETLFLLICEWFQNFGKGTSMSKFKMVARAIGKRLGFSRLPPRWIETLQQRHGVVVTARPHQVPQKLTCFNDHPGDSEIVSSTTYERDNIKTDSSNLSNRLVSTHAVTFPFRQDPNSSNSLALLGSTSLSSIFPNSGTNLQADMGSLSHSPDNRTDDPPTPKKWRLVSNSQHAFETSDSSRGVVETIYYTEISPQNK